MALSYNLGYQESISVHPTRRQNFLANHTRISPTSENDSYTAGGSLLCFRDIWISKPHNLTLFLYDPTPLITSYSSLPLTDPARITISGPLQCVGGALEI